MQERYFMNDQTIERDSMSDGLTYVGYGSAVGLVCGRKMWEKHHWKGIGLWDGGMLLLTGVPGQSRTAARSVSRADAKGGRKQQ